MAEHETDFFERKPVTSRRSDGSPLLGHRQRSRAYLEEVEARTQIRQVDEHEVVFESHYLDWDVREYTRLIDQDRFRSRAIYTGRKGGDC